MVTLTTVQLRQIMQLPERPFEDVYPFDGTSYFDLSQKEPCTMLQVSGTASGVPAQFRQNIDYQLTAGCIDWTVIGGKKPDLNTPFIVDYTWSKLGGDAASMSCANANMILAQDLGPTYPYGASTSAGNLYDRVALYGAMLIGAREAAQTLAVADIDLSQKARRGAVLVDDSKKTDDWADVAKKFDQQYKRYLSMINPAGMRRIFTVIQKNSNDMVLGRIGQIAFDGYDWGDSIPYAGFDGGGFM